MWRRLLPLTLAEWRHHPWRHGVALLAVALGVALASSVQLINHSALSEFTQAVRSVNGQPDVVLAARTRQGLDERLLEALQADESLAAASPVLEVDSHARSALPRRNAAQQPGPGAAIVATTGEAADAAPGTAASAADKDARGAAEAAPLRLAVRVLGIDALQVARVAPELLPRAAASAPRTAAIDPMRVWLNAAARARLQAADGEVIELQSSAGWRTFLVGGAVAAGGAPLVVMDIAAAQQAFDRAGRLSRIDLRLVPGVDRARWLTWQQLPGDAQVVGTDDAVQRVSNLSRAYRVNLGVLALVALLVGGFLVYSVVSLSVAQRVPQLALLGVLGLAARERRAWVLAESALLGALGSAIGLALGAALAAAALRLLGGDLGSGYFTGVAPSLAWPLDALIACYVLGTAAAVVGAWWPARAAEALQPAQALKGLGPGGMTGSSGVPAWPTLALLLAGTLLALLPPVAGLPLAAYASVALLLAGGVTAVPWAVQVLLAWHGRGGAAARHPGLLPWLAWQRADFARQTASATVAGVVASLALAVALTVMVGSFRAAVGDWLDTVLPADLYARSSASTAAAEQSALPDGLVAAVAALPGVARLQASRVLAMAIAPQQPAVALLARPLPDPASQLVLLAPPRPLPAGEVGVFVSEPAAALHRWAAGDLIRLPLPGAEAQRLRVRGIWRDYARQFGAVAIDLADYQRLTGDLGLNDLALWLQPGAAVADVEAALGRLGGREHPLEMAATAQLRRVSLQIFDRSFAVTRYLQAVAIAVGLVGVAASLSAQVLARRKEFGLLAHLGFTRRQVVALVTLESLAWLAAGCLVGVALGLGIAVVLVHVVNPQSFHWTMPLQIPVGRLLALVGAVLAAGAVTAAFSARRAASRQAVLAVKEDW